MDEFTFIDMIVLVFAIQMVLVFTCKRISGFSLGICLYPIGFVA